MEYFARRFISLSFFSLFMLLAASSVFAGGRQDKDLSRADELIDNRQYEEAITILTDFARRHPEKFDLAQTRLRSIHRFREEFNRTADELIVTLMEEPENDEKILALSNHLYSLEHEDSLLLQNFVGRTREIAAFNVSRNNLRNIMERARRQLDRNESFAAIQIYSEGMDIMRNEFFLADYGMIIESDTRRETENINTMIASFQQASSQMGTISAELARAIPSGNAAAISEITNRLTISMDRFIAMKQGVYASVNSFERNLDSIKANEPDIGDRNHLSFLSAVIRGRPDESIQEGMLGAFDNYWNNSIGNVVRTITNQIERANTAALSSLEARNYQAVLTALNNINYFVNLTPFYFDKHRQLFDRNQQTTTLFNTVVVNQDIAPFLSIRALGEANNFLSQAANVPLRGNFDRTALTRWQSGEMNAVQALNAETQTRNEITAMQNSIYQIVMRANQVHADITRYYDVPHVYNAARVIENMRLAYVAEEQQSAQRFYTIASQRLAQSRDARRAQLETAIRFLDGEEKIGPDGVMATFFYPAEAFSELTSMISNINQDLAGGNTVLRQHEGERPEISGITEITATRADQVATIASLNEILAQGNALLENSRLRSGQAEALRQDGERIYREAVASFQRQNFDTAREQLYRASDRLTESLEIQESAAIRQMRDTQLVNLGNSIASSQNESIIGEVRNLVNAARTSYFAGNFAQAEDSLVRARNRWRITNTEENEEVIYWLGIVRTALSATSGRVIPPTAPLFPEMSQLLNQAQRNFEEGVRFLNAGQRPQGIAKFDEAKELTREVRLMFPVNQEAGILDLRIEQFMDPAAFNASFEQRLRTAIAGTRQRSMEAYADLLNLAEINPRYPNMRGIVTQAEIDMGFRPPPPNPADLARSRELTASASRILESNNTAQYQAALIQLNQAISLNPQNLEAPQIRDRLVSRMSVPGGVVLSSRDEADYQRALRELQAGNNLAAFALVERLMQNPQNRNVTKLVELQRRIQSVL